MKYLRQRELQKDSYKEHLCTHHLAKERKHDSWSCSLLWTPRPVVQLPLPRSHWSWTPCALCRDVKSPNHGTKFPRYLQNKVFIFSLVVRRLYVLVQISSGPPAPLTVSRCSLGMPAACQVHPYWPQMLLLPFLCSSLHEHPFLHLLCWNRT